MASTTAMQTATDWETSYTGTLLGEVARLEHTMKNTLDGIASTDERVGFILVLMQNIFSGKLDTPIVARVKSAMVEKFGHTRDRNDVLLRSVLLMLLYQLLAVTVIGAYDVWDWACTRMFSWIKDKERVQAGAGKYLAEIQALRRETPARFVAFQWLHVISYFLEQTEELGNSIQIGTAFLLEHELQERRLSFAMLGKRRLPEDGNRVDLPREVIDMILENLVG